MVPNLMSGRFSEPDSAAAHIRMAMLRIEQDAEKNKLYEQEPSSSRSVQVPAVQFDVSSYISHMLRKAELEDDREPNDPSRVSSGTSFYQEQLSDPVLWNDHIEERVAQEIQEAALELESTSQDDPPPKKEKQAPIKRKIGKGKSKRNKAVKRTPTSSPRSTSYGSEED